MSQLFDNYKRNNLEVPNNENVFIRTPKEYKDIIVLGGKNNHTFLIPYNFDELRYFSVTYIQGTETILTKRFDTTFFREVSDEEDFGIKEYRYDALGAKENGSVLYQVNKEYIKDFYENDPDDDLDDEDLVVASCVLFYTISPEESLLFNDWNKEVYCQLKVEIDTNVDEEQIVVTEYSRKYKIKVLGTLKEKEDNE